VQQARVGEICRKNKNKNCATLEVEKFRGLRDMCTSMEVCMTRARTTSGTLQTLSVLKGGQYFCFRYEDGQEIKVLEAIYDMIKTTNNAFDWFDAAILAHQLRRRLIDQIYAELGTLSQLQKIQKAA
jgi:hypothetical protein